MKNGKASIKSKWVYVGTVFGWFGDLEYFGNGLIHSFLFVNMAKQQKQIERKYEILELQNTIQLAFTDTSNCSCQFQGLNFNPNKAAAPINLLELKDGCGNQSVTLAQPGQIINGSRTGLKAESVDLIGLKPVATDLYIGKISIQFDDSSAKIARKPLVLSQAFNVSGSGGNRQIDSCTNKVSIDNSSPNCASGEVVTVGANGERICSRLNDFFASLGCNSGETIEFDANGQIKCAKPGGLAPSPSAPTKKTCSGSPHGSIVFYTCKAYYSSYNSVSGSGVQLKCDNGTWKVQYDRCSI